MKYSLFILFLLIISVFPMQTVSADPTIIIESYELIPEIFMPGDSGVLRLAIKNAEITNTLQQTENIGGTTTVHTDTIGAIINNIRIIPAYDGDKEVRATQKYDNIGELAPGSSFDVSFKIKVEENISEGLYFPLVWIDVKNYQDVKFPIEVKVSNDTVDLISTSVPSKISIGGSTDISLSIVNKRKNTVDNVDITPVKNNDIEFNPNSIFLGSLDPNGSDDIIFSLKPIETGKINLSFILSYENGDNLHNEKLALPIEIVDILDVAPVFTNIPLTVKKGGSTRIGLEVYNAKTETITGVIITPITDATVIPSQYFIGAMDPDDVFSASFDLYTDMLDYGDHTIEFRVSFKQGNEYYETPSISHSYSIVSGDGTSYQSSTNENSELSDSFGLNAGFFNTCIIIILVIVLIVVIFIIWRWKKGRKTK